MRELKTEIQHQLESTKRGRNQNLIIRHQKKTKGWGEMTKCGNGKEVSSTMERMAEGGTRAENGR